jgi:hypothetical protein
MMRKALPGLHPNKLTNETIKFLHGRHPVVLYKLLIYETKSNKTIIIKTINIVFIQLPNV